MPNKRCEMSDGVFAAAAKPAVSERRFIMLVTHIVKKDQPTKSIEREGRGLLNVATDLVGYCGDSIIAFRKRRLVCDFLVVLFRRSLLDRRDVVLFYCCTEAIEFRARPSKSARAIPRNLVVGRVLKARRRP